MSYITIYHGSEKIIKIPTLFQGKKSNDYGQDFYCTKDKRARDDYKKNLKSIDYVNDTFILDLIRGKIGQAGP